MILSFAGVDVGDWVDPTGETRDVAVRLHPEDRVFYIAATKVKINTNVDCPIVVDKTKFKNSLTINEYLKKLTDFNKAFFAKLSSRLPKGQEPLMYDENCEDCSERIEFFNKK